uniref:Putative inactive poly(ADP-ribose) polymerase SRO2 n=1 Tax=Davidia involucrata TaxID=16924 RepID=A0A5B7AX47_DAVIN
MDHIGIEEQVSMTVDDHEISSADSEIDSSASSSSEQFRFLTQKGMIQVEEGNSEHEIIKKSFLEGIGPLGKDTNIVAIHRNSHSCLTGKARLETFRIFSEAVAKKCGGNANIKHAWYGASRDEVCEIISHGFSQCRPPENRELYGLGVYLSPAIFSIDGASSAVVDENGLRHVLLCRVILGNMEVVCAGSEQSQPSSKEFDSGVDDLSAPKRYIIWSPYMNSHILPNYIISFRAPCSRGSQRIRAPIMKPNSPYMKLPTLMSILSGFLPPSKMILISKYHSDFQENKITRPRLVQMLRQLAGDKLLTAVIKLHRNKKLEARPSRSSVAANPNSTRRYAAEDAQV